jgi:hypothetical protein
MRESSVEDESVYSQLTGARVSSLLDGVRLVLTIPDASALWRTRLLLEHRLGDIAHDAVKNVSDEVYIEYPRTGETEYCDLTEDPHQPQARPKSPRRSRTSTTSPERTRRCGVPRGG